MTFDQLPAWIVLVALAAVIVSALYCVYQYLVLLYHRTQFLIELHKGDYF